MILSLKTPNHQLVRSTTYSSYKSLSVLYIYTNADQLIKKRDLLLVQIANKNPDLILISEILPKAPNSIIHSALFAIPGYSFLIKIVSPTYVVSIYSFLRRYMHRR